jgi:hypothetical protein
VGLWALSIYCWYLSVSPFIASVPLLLHGSVLIPYQV